MIERRLQLDLRQRTDQDECLRNQFAMAALTGLVASPHAVDIENIGDMAKFCYRIADAMMEEKHKD